MITVCIPVYNVDVSALAAALKSQAEGISAEIILIDDASEPGYREINSALQDERIQYHELEKNIGRAKIRNLFTKHANDDHLLFLDCDSVVFSENFLSDYAAALKEHPGHVICGGRIYEPKPPKRSKRLHWKYGIRKESQPVNVRRQEPNRSFMTNNFLIPIQILRDIPFNENLSGYGHEDSLFGYDLSRNGHNILHIDNPVLHGDLQTNREFLDKTKEAVHNLVRITDMLEDDPGFFDSITLLRTVQNIEKRKLAGILRTVSFCTIRLFKGILSLGCASLKLLDAYKLGLYLRLKK
ncbi:glycosyltransferase family 2 protein [Bacteroidota bacterium]